MQIRKHFRFEAAHVLPYHTGKCSRLHGDSYRLDVGIDGPLGASGPATGMVIDVDELSRIVRGGVIDGENIVLWIRRRLRDAVRFFAPVDDLVARVRAEGGACPMVILTGGEPLVFLQPGGNKPANVALALDAALREPARYRLSLQTHTFIGVR